MSQQLFRSRRLQSLFPSGVAAAFIVGLLLASLLLGSSITNAVIGTLVFGLAGSGIFYAFLKFFVEPRIKRRP